MCARHICFAKGASDNSTSFGMKHAHSLLGNLRVLLLANKMTNRLRKWSFAKKIYSPTLTEICINFSCIVHLYSTFGWASSWCNIILSTQRSIYLPLLFMFMFCNGSQQYQHFNPSSVGMKHAHSPLGNLRVQVLANND